MDFFNVTINTELTQSVVKYIFSSLGGALCGSLFAYKLAKKREENRIDTEKIKELQLVLFLLSCQVKTIINYKVQVLETCRNNSLRHYSLQCIVIQDYLHYAIDIKQISFLLTTECRNILSDVVVLNNTFFTIIELITRRNNTYAELQKAMEDARYSSDSIPLEFFDRVIGDRLRNALKSDTDNLYILVDNFVNLYMNNAPLFLDRFNELFPNKGFQKLDIVGGTNQ